MHEHSYISPMHDSFEKTLEVEHQFNLLSAHSVGVVLGAICKSGVRLTGCLVFQGVPHGLRFPERSDSRSLSRSGTPAKTFSMRQLTQMKDLLSNLTSFEVHAFTYLLWGDGEPFDTYDFEWIYKLLANTTRLEKLYLACGDVSHGFTDVGILQTMEDQSICFPRLKELRLFDMLLDPQALLRFLMIHIDTLTGINLGNIALVTAKIM